MTKTVRRIRVLSNEEVEVCYRKQRKQEKEQAGRPNYFDRVKRDNYPTKDIDWLFKGRIYFDCETYELYSDPDNPDELPIIVPYAIGWCYETPGTYQCLMGENVAKEFLITVLASKSAKRGRLVAFNLDYDFQVLRPWLIEVFGNRLKVLYEMTDNKKFIHGELKGDGIDVRVRDLWRWDTSMGLASYMKHIVSFAFNEDGSVKQDKLCEWATGSYCAELGAELIRWGLNPNSFKKLSIDYKKVNLFKSNDGNFYYWRSKEDWIAGNPPVLLDKDREYEYLKLDVLALPVIEKDQELFKKYAKQLLKINRPHDLDRSITLPGFAKYLCEEYTEHFFTESVRQKVDVDSYRHECKSYIGAFTGGNEQVTYMDEETFNRQYPNLSFYDEDNEPRIKSYDVNSMYPWAMRTGLPYGAFHYHRPSKNCVEWVEIHFTKWWDEHNPDKSKRLYQWKPKYACLNNSFFGDSFVFGVFPGLEATNRVYVLRQTLDLFYEMCNAHVKEVCSRYQLVYKKLNSFIDLLYEIKANRGNKWPPSTVKVIKLLLNALYGKMCEKYKEHKILWVNDIGHLAQYAPDYLDNLRMAGLVEFEIDNKNKIEQNKKVVKSRSFKSYVSPYWDLDKDCGYVRVQNTDKRYDADGNDCRESILAGAYVTYLSRWKLLSAVKDEIDNGNVVLYCDTDSIKLVQINKPRFKTDDRKLGAWKYEGSFTHFGHPNKKKKYFMHNQHTGKWMVKTSGISDSVLRGSDGMFNLQQIKTIYDPNNRVIIANAKTTNIRNDLWQTVIRDGDFKFVFDDPKDVPTHIMKGGELIAYGEA